MGIKIFQVVWRDWDITRWHLFIGLEECNIEKFKNICDDVIRQAAEDVMAGQFRSDMWKDYSKGAKVPVGYDVLIEELVSRLADYGFVELDLATVEYRGGFLLMGEDGDLNNVVAGDLFDRVKNHNQTILDEEVDVR